MIRNRKRMRERWMCDTGLPWSVSRSGWTWVAWAKGSVGDRTDGVCEVCVGV